MVIKKDKIKRKNKLVSNKTRLSNKDKRSKVAGIDIDIHKNAEEALRLQSEITNNMAEGVILTRAKDAVIIYTNPKFEEMFGYDSGELIGKKVAIVNAPTDKSPEEVAGEIQKSLKETGTWQGEVKNIKKDGTPFWCYVNVTTFKHYDYGDVWVATHLDITERKKTQEEISKLAKFPSENPNPILRIGTDGEIIYANPASLPLLNEWGTKVGELLPEPWKDFALNTLRTNSIHSSEYSVGQQTFSLEFCPIVEMDYVNIYGLEITGRKQAEALVKNSEQNFHNSLDSSLIGIRIVDKDGRNLYLNQTFLNFFGYKNREEVEASPPQEHYTPESFAEYVRRGERLAQGEPLPDEYEIDIVCKNGAIRHLQLFRKEVLWDGKPQYQILYNDITERVQAERKLKDSENRNSAIVENLPQNIYLKDINLAFMMCNKNHAREFKLKPEEIIGKTDHDLFPREIADKYEADDRNILVTGETEDMEERQIVDGQERIVHVIKVPAKDENGNINGIAGIYWDITEPKQAEEIIKNSEQSLHNALGKLPMGFRITDIDDNTLYLNQAFLDIFGYVDAEEVGRRPPLRDFYTPESYADYLVRNEKLLRGEPRPDKIEVDIIRKDGERRHLQLSTVELVWNGKQQFQTIYNDITERRQAEEALKLSEQNLRNSMESSIMAIRIVDAEWHTLYINQKFLDMFGYKDINDVSRYSLQDRYTPEEKSRYLERMARKHRGESVPDNPKVDIIGKDGDILSVVVYSNEVLWNSKKAQQLIYQDVTERQKAEDALKVSELNFHNSLDSSFMGIYIADTDWHILYVNHAFLDIFGYENIEEVRTSPPHQHYTKESYADYLKRNERLAQDEPNPDNFVIDIIRKDGAIRHLQIFRKEVLWDGKQQSQLLYNDITERVQAEKNLHESEEKYRLIVENSSDIIFTLNGAGEFIYVSAAVKKVLGYNQNDLLGIPFRAFVHPDDVHIIDKAEKSHHLDSTQTTINDEYRFRNASGEWRWLVSTGTPSREKDEKVFNFIGIARDVTEQKQAEEKVQQAAQEWITTFDSITDMISIHDKDNRIVRVNKAMADLLKTTPQALIGKLCHEVMHGTKEPPANCPHFQTLKTGKSAAMETFNPTFEIYFHEASSPLFNEKGEVTGSVIVARDVTKQKRTEEQLIVTDRLASIGELSAGIAHELNNPLTSVIGFSQLLMAGNVTADIKNDLAIINSEAQRAAVIVKNLLTFARKHAPVTQLGQVNTVIEDVLKLRAYEQKVNNIEVEKHLAADLPEIMMDPFQIQQVFLNIIVNAEFAMLEAHQRGKLVITTERADGVVRITFTDDGPGITESNLKSIFDPFFTTKEVGKGTGLGLSICHGIVTEHGGKIYASSIIGQGSTFIVELPLNSQ
jgi:PAS domain S-box-containing protein